MTQRMEDNWNSLLGVNPRQGQLPSAAGGASRIGPGRGAESADRDEEKIEHLLQDAKDLFKEGKYQESNAVYFAVLKQKELLRDLFAVYIEVADNCCRMGKPSKAKRWIAKCLGIETSPNRMACAHAQLAAAECRLGDSDAQLKHCLTALRLFDSTGEDYDPACEWNVYCLTGRAYYDRRSFAMAASYLGEALKSAKERKAVAELNYFLGNCFACLGAHDSALSSYLAAFEAGVEDVAWITGPQIRGCIANEMYNIGRKDEGREWYQRALDACNDVSSRRETMEWMALSLASSGETDEAVRLYEPCADAAETKHERAQVYYRMAQMLSNVGAVRRTEDWLNMSLEAQPTKQAKRLLRRLKRRYP